MEVHKDDGNQVECRMLAALDRSSLRIPCLKSVEMGRLSLAERNSAPEHFHKLSKDKQGFAIKI